MKKGTKIIICNSTTGEWDTKATVLSCNNNICFFEYDDKERQKKYKEKYKEPPCLIYYFNNKTETNKNVKIIEE